MGSPVDRKPYLFHPQCNASDRLLFSYSSTTYAYVLTHISIDEKSFSCGPSFRQFAVTPFHRTDHKQELTSVLFDVPSQMEDFYANLTHKSQLTSRPFPQQQQQQKPSSSSPSPISIFRRRLRSSPSYASSDAAASASAAADYTAVAMPQPAPSYVHPLLGKVSKSKTLQSRGSLWRQRPVPCLRSFIQF